LQPAVRPMLRRLLPFEAVKSRKGSVRVAVGVSACLFREGRGEREREEDQQWNGSLCRLDRRCGRNLSWDPC
jgi:hypothetical protein